LADGAPDALAALMGASLAMDADRLGIQLWRLPQGLPVEIAARILADLPGVAHVQPNYEISVSATSNDPYLPNLWGLNNTGQVYGYTGGSTPLSGTPDADIDAPQAWDTRTDAPLVVAVIDTGVDYTHPDLDANVWTNPGEVAGNGVDDDGNGYVDDVHGWDFVNNDANPIDDHGHGTHVAGTIGAEGDNGIGIAGIAWSVEIMALKFLNASGSGFTSGAIAALNYAVANGAKISNNSWGGGDYSQALKDAIDAAGAADHLFVAAAGNNGRDIDALPAYPAAYDAANVISVAATDDEDKLASFSNYGAVNADLAAPGVSILSTYRGGYGFMNGTSMATPHVTGAAALVWAENPSLTAVEVKQILLDTVDPLAALAGKVATGGRLNLDAALAAAAGEPPSPAIATIAAVQASLAEGNSGTTAFSFTVTLDRPANGTQTLGYSVAGSGAAPASAADFGGSLPSGTVTFLNGESLRTIVVPVSGDTAVEPAEGFTVTLGTPSAGLQIGTGTASATILNDDSAPAGNTITGTNSANTLNGTSGPDSIFGLDGNDRLNGLGGSDWLDGGGGRDTMTGGAGDDRYVRDHNNDLVSELSNEGNDTVFSSLAYTLPSNVEALVLTGSAAINATGNSAANLLVGNAAANVLSGAAGADTMDGGSGNDTFVVDNAGDVLVERDGGGSDLAQSSVTYTIGDFVEQLTLTGSSGTGGTGNGGANLITGNGGANALSGLGGNDTLVGGNGNDALSGGAGSDSLYGGNGRDSLAGGDGVDYFGFRATAESPRGS
ncbi:MAG: S8 family serine peptidase, partial [Alphaproteobacteria bacterium]